MGGCGTNICWYPALEALDFMIENWSYLILNNRDYWTPQMPTMARAIELKLASLPNPDYRLFFPEEVPFSSFYLEAAVLAFSSRAFAFPSPAFAA